MKLKARLLGSLDGVDPKFHELYTETTEGDDTVFVLNVEGVAEHPDAKALHNALNRQKTRVRELGQENETLKARVEGLPDDFDADQYEELKRKAEASGGQAPNEDEIRREAAEAATKRATDKFDKERTKLEGERDKYRTKLEQKAIREQLDEQLEAAGVTDPVMRRAARALLKERGLKIVEEDDELVVLAKDDALGEIPLAEHVKTWAGSDEGKAFVGARQSAGGGANGNAPNGNPANQSSSNPWKSGDSFNVTEQARIRKADPVKAAQLMREAGIVPAAAA